MMKTTLAVLLLLIAATPCAAQTPPHIEWQVQNQFRLFKTETGTASDANINMGPTDAATRAALIVKRWNPSYVLLVGIACGIEGETDHGDILIANQVADYTLGKQQEGRRKVRWTVTPGGASLLDSAINLSKKWQRRIGVPRPGLGAPRTRKGVVASGGDVIADDRIIAAYSEDWPKLVGIEMEAGGIATALQQTAERPEFLMIKGVSDFGKDKHDADVVPWRS